ncbi:MAG: prepilin-type N-terminal cleavage/methylation domain-containing protein [Candidatus Dadabacteria bacterium]|nr:prepilin-type N-terminal cleavage/methylation domain-containing protein [Candidatus Dadabacteria bacterium]NIS07357.1 prepilin-type N-terminal cleavage/methylation domain-containing protein [Candidatus Dadabacteria bacterium]NIV41301.1 prepilin-type N-terminal cleavage/methylation domain-containing protein [Candidatus Dadabacteria bacterium]NIX14536.1 prepilin-type N-terminal cleavage/methylation domain-containing protein [Candidatus Dadabacteria bacterium]NIY20994.1 prepilin-type N-terminal
MKNASVCNTGFTLIELSIVVLILSAFMFVAVPRFDNLTRGNLKSSSRNLSTTIKYLYSEAAFKKKIHKLAFDIDEGEYWVEVLEVDEYIKSPDPFLRKKKLPHNVFFKDIVTQRSQGASTEGKDEFILFLPSGFVEPVVIHLESEAGDIYTLATKPYTGATRVFDEYKDILIQ